MKIRKIILVMVISLIMVNLAFSFMPITKVQAAPSYDKAEIYYKITTSSSLLKSQTTTEQEGAGSSCTTTTSDQVSFIVEGTTKLESDIFDIGEEYNELSPVERDIKASCSGGGSIRINGTRLLTNPDSVIVLQQRLFPFSSQENWSYSMDGKKLLDEYGETIELVNSLCIYPSDKKGETPTYEVNINADALAAINYYHVIARGNSSSISQDYEGTYTDSGVIEGGGSYGLSLMCATGYTEAIESDKAQEDFVKGKFKLENDKFVSSGRLSYTYKIDGSQDCFIDVQFKINRDPQIKNIQVNQGLGRYEYTDDENYIPATDFVAGKETAIQVFFFEETPVDKIENAKLEVYRDGVRIATLKDSKKDKDNNALNFIPNNIAQCENWKSGNYKFKALYDDTEFVLDSVKLTKMPKLRILAVPLKANYEGVVKSPGSQWMYGHRFMKKVFPVADEDIEWIIRPDPLDVSSYMYNLTSNEGQWKVSEQLKKLQASNSVAQYDVIAGFVADGTAGFAGYTYRILSVVISDGDPDMPATVAHEIGHLYNLGEEYKGGGYNTSVNMPPYGYKGKDWFDISKPASGTDKNVKTSKHGEGVNISKDLHPFEVGSRGLLEDSIGFMGGGAELDNIWITPSVWRHLFKEFLTKSNETPNDNVDENTIALRPAGYITNSGEIVVDYPWKVTYGKNESVIQTTAQTGSYEIQALDAEGTVLARQFFTPTFFPATYTGQSSTSSESNKFSLHDISIPFKDGTVKFNIIKDNASIIEIPVSGHAPTISLKTPIDGGEFSESKTIEWEGNDPDGDKLYYTVEYSHNGTQWFVLQPDITDSQLTVDFSFLPGGEKACIRIIASDGINSAKVETELFTVPYKAPELFVDEAVVSPEGVTFSASAYDSADGWMYDDRITWISDKDGEVGKGSALFLTTLSKGDHSITITAKNGHGQQAEKTFNIIVNSSGGKVSDLLSAILPWLPSFENMIGFIFLAVAFLVIILIVVIIARAVTKKKKCQKCGQKHKRKAKVCPKCGYPLEGDNASLKQKLTEHEQPQPSVKICQECGKQDTPEAKFCENCGNRFLDKQPQLKQDLQQEQPQQNINSCRSCGRQNAPNATFCADCGGALK